MRALDNNLVHKRPATGEFKRMRALGTRIGALLGICWVVGCKAEPLTADGAVARDAQAPADDGGTSDARDMGQPTDAGGHDLDAGRHDLDASAPKDPGTTLTDLCEGLRKNDLTNRPLSPRSRPALGEAIVDPAFGATIRRISAGAVPMYSTVSAWNADESLLILYAPGKGHALFDGRSYAALGSLPIAPNDLEQVYWHTEDPNVLYFTQGTALRRHLVAEGVTETVRDFAFCKHEVGAGGDPFFTSFDSGLIGLACGDTHFLYRIDTDTVTGMQNAPSRDLAPQASPSGARAYWEGDVVGTDLSVQRTLPLDNPYEHASMGITSQGRDVYLSVVFDGDPVGSLVSFDMLTGAPKVIIGPETGYPYPPGGTHVSGLAYRNPGWAWLSIVGKGDGASLLNGELVVANFETGAVCRAGHHRSTGEDYFAEPHVVASPSGTRAVFGSDWGGGSIDGYVIELPTYSP